MFRRAVPYVLGGALLALLLWGFWIEPSGLAKKNYQISLQGWPKACDNLTVAVVADLHIGAPYYGLARLTEVVDMVNAIQPDLVLLAGDYVTHKVLFGTAVAPETVAPGLAGLKAKMGVFAVLGNHDWWVGGRRIHHSLEHAGITVLEDASVEIVRGGCHFFLAGISDYWEGFHDIGKALAGIPDKAAIVALTHNPDVFVDIPQRVAITFAGHTHGGQVNLPLIGPPVTMSQYGQRFVSGHIIEEGHHLFVSPGLGTSILPVRFRVPPEISVVTLQTGEGTK